MGENKMKLEKLLERMDYKVLAGSTDIEISLAPDFILHPTPSHSFPIVM